MFHQFDLILTKSIQEIDQYDPRDMSTLAISLAKIIDKMSKRKGASTKGSPHQILQDLIGENKQFIFREIASASVPILHKFDPRHLSNMIYAFGLVEEVVLVTDGSTFFDMLAEVSIPNLYKSNGQDLSNMLWAYANVKVSNSQLFEKVADHIVGLDNLNSFNGQDLSNTVWAYATLDEQQPQLFKKLADHIVGLGNLKSFNGQDCSNTLWAYATAGESHPKLFKKLAYHINALPNLHDFNEQELSNTVWAYATAEEKHPKLFKRLADHIIALDKLDKFNEQNLSNVVWAYATAEESYPILFNRLANEAIKRQHEFTAQGIANFLWAYATNGQIDEHLFLSLVPSVKENLDKYNEQDLANVAWAYSVANVDIPTLFNNDFINSCLKKEDDFIPEALTQLHQWQLWQEEIKSGVSLPSPLQKICYETFISDEPRPSKFQDDVVSILSSIGLQPREEVLLKSGYRIDALVEVNGKQIAVEVDGPSHFIGKELTGSTILKHRQVAALDGMSVVSVPYWEWNKLKKDSKKKEKYLLSMLGQS